MLPGPESRSKSEGTNVRIERFRVRRTDDFGPRVAEIRTDKGEFKTPSRAATSTEYNYKKNLKIVEPFENSVGEYVARFNSDDIKRFGSRNGSYSSRLRTASSYTDTMKYVISKAYPQYPFEYNFPDEVIRLILDVQVESGLDMVSIPHSAGQLRNLSRHYNRWASYVERCAETHGRKVVAVPHVPMKLPEETFQSIIRSLWDEKSRFPVIGLIYGSITANKINYSFLRSHNDKDVWLHMSAVERISHAAAGPIAQMHLPQIYGIDTVSAGIPWGGGGGPPPSYRKLRYYDRPTLSLPRIEDWIRSHRREDSGCGCPICQGHSFDRIVRDFIAQRTQAIDLTPLFGVFRLHEVFQSTEELEQGQRYISENAFAQYLGHRIGSALDEHRD
jgi:hypothetical protein